MSESCGRARGLLWPDKGPRAVDEETVAAQRHLEGCADCRAFFEEMDSLRGAVRSSLGRVTAPIHVREAVYARLADARFERRSRRWSVGLGAAAILALALVGSLVFLPPHTPEIRLVSLMAAEHAKALGGDYLSSSDSDEVERWLAARVAFAVHVPELSGARLTGARICLTRDGRGVIVEYAAGDRALSYFVLPAPRESPAIESEPTHAAEDGYRIVLWQDAGLVHAMVGALEEEDLERLARECIDQAKRLARLGVNSGPPVELKEASDAFPAPGQRRRRHPRRNSVRDHDADNDAPTPTGRRMPMMAMMAMVAMVVRSDSIGRVRSLGGGLVWARGIV